VTLFRLSHALHFLIQASAHAELLKAGPIEPTFIPLYFRPFGQISWDLTGSSNHTRTKELAGLDLGLN